MIDNGQIEMEQSKLKGIKDWPTPTKVKELRSFLGFCNFYHHFIRNHADRSKPLNKLLKKTEPWNWTEEQQKSFEDLKDSFSKEPVLLIPDQDKPFFIVTDASLYATGAVLEQEDTNGDCHPCAFLSQMLNAAEQKYQVYDRELLSIL